MKNNFNHTYFERLIRAVFVVLVLCALTAPVYGAGQTHIRVKDEIISVKLEGVPLRAVLGELSRQAGIKVFLEQGLHGSISTSFTNLSLEEGLKRLLSNYSHSVIFSKVKAAQGKEKIVISEVKVFEKGKDQVGSFEAISGSGEIASKDGNADSNQDSKETDSESISDASRGEAGSGVASVMSTEGLSGPVAAMVKRNRMEMLQLRREISAMRRDLSETSFDDPREEAAARGKIAQKTLELQKREQWLESRKRGMMRIERRPGGVNQN